MKSKVYLETTIPSYLAGRPSRDLVVAANQQITHDRWESRRRDFDLHASELVIIEMRAGDPEMAKRRLDLLAGVTMLGVTEEMMKLAGELVRPGPVPRKASADAAHIAVAAVHGCEYLLTWNCRHIANAEMRREMRRVVEEYG